MLSTIRALIIGLALSVAAVPQAGAETTATETIAKLIAMDAELARCWRQRAVAAMIAVNYLRECIAGRRKVERELKEELNKGISVLGTDDPERGRLLAARNKLREFSRFMALLDDGLKDHAPEIALTEAGTLVDVTCDLARDSGSERALGGRAAGDAGDGHVEWMLCMPTEPER